MGGLKHFVVVVVLVTLCASALAAVSADEIRSLPGFDGPLPSRLYSGYLPVHDTLGTKYYHYVFSEAVGINPKTAPVALWLNGGPGSSSLIGFFTEQGPFSLNIDSLRLNKTETPRLFLNPYGWTNVANFLWLESPAGVGFSYCDFKPCLFNDSNTAHDNHEVLKAFFERFPEYAANYFYISGESYAGIYIPMIADLIMNDKANKINLKGLAIGNGCIGNKVGTCGFEIESQRISSKFLYGHGAYSDTLRNRILDACANWTSLTVKCSAALLEMSREVGPYEIYAYYDSCGGNGIFRTAEEHRLHYASAEFGAGEIRGTNDYACGGGQAQDAYLARPEVIAAFHVKAGTAGMLYTRTVADLLPVYKRLAEKYRVLIYSGDADGCVPYVGTQEWTYNLGYPVAEAWRPWKAASLSSSDETTAGYVTKFSAPAGFTFLTIKGAGHMVPEFKPVQALAMWERFVKNQRF